MTAISTRPANGGGSRQDYRSGQNDTADSKFPGQNQYPVIGQLSDNHTCTIGSTVTSGRNSIFAACRELLRQGVEPDRALEIYRRGILALRIRSIEEGARLTVREDRGPPEFASYKAPPHDVGRPRAAIEHRVGTIQPGQAEAAE